MNSVVLKLNLANMNEKQLTTNQIKELHRLVERNAIKYYDVEVEIVDHYASAIEEIWADDPSVSFYRAQMMVYKEFWDFQGLMKDKQSALRQRAYKEYWGHLKEAFTWPKILELLGITALLFYGFNFLFEIITPQNLSNILMISVIACAISQFGEVRFFNKNLGRSFLRLETIQTSLFTITFIWLSIFFEVLDILDLSSTIIKIGISLVFALFIIMIKETFMVLKKEISEHKKQYT